MAKNELTYVKPREGAVIRDPFTKKVIPPEGGWVKDDLTVGKHIRANDLFRVDPPAVVEEAAPLEPATTEADEPATDEPTEGED